MRELLETLARRLKRDPSYALDSQLTTKAILAMLVDVGLKLLRGSVMCIAFREAAGRVFIGRGVTIRNSEYLSVGRSFVAEAHSEIQALSQEGVVFGDNVTIGRYAMIRPSGYYGREIGVGLRVGNNSNIGAYSYIGASGSIEIGDNVLMGPRVSLLAEQHNYDRLDIPMKQQGVSRGKIVIEDDCWLGSGCEILSGVTVHRGAIVATGSVVTKDVPPYSIVAGVPARVIKWRKPPDATDERGRN